MSNTRKPLSQALSTEWAQMGHALYIESLMSQTQWRASDLAFHGGTSLRLSWSSARHSEDLDFLLSKDVENFDRIAQKASLTMGEFTRRIDPDFEIETKNNTKDVDRMASYTIAISHPAYIGKAKIKAEFWRTNPAYLEKYPTQLRTPKTFSSAIDVFAITTSPIPAATLETAYADKLTAFATRPYLKWRDLYDLWWIGTQTSADLQIDAVCEQFLHNISAYTPIQGLPPEKALRLFLEKSKDQILQQADPGIKNWLPSNLWLRLHPSGIKEIVDYVFLSLETISRHISDGDSDAVDLKSIPRMR